jgi:HD-like signal output (HDOD) protein
MFCNVERKNVVAFRDVDHTIYECPLDLRRAKAERNAYGYCYATVGAGFARMWQFPEPIVDALEHQFAPFDNTVYEPLAGVIHLAT